MIWNVTESIHITHFWANKQKIGEKVDDFPVCVVLCSLCKSVFYIAIKLLRLLMQCQCGMMYSYVTIGYQIRFEIRRIASETVNQRFMKHLTIFNATQFALFPRSMNLSLLSELLYHLYQFTYFTCIYHIGGEDYRKLVEVTCVLFPWFVRNYELYQRHNSVRIKDSQQRWQDATEGFSVLSMMRQ